MPRRDQAREHVIREAAYWLWEREGRPEGRALEHWLRATAERAPRNPRSVKPMPDEEKILEGHADVNLPALLTKDVHGG